MARKSTTFQIEGYEKSFTVNELTVKQIIELLRQDFGDTSLDGLKKQFETFLPVASNVTLSDLYEMSPSDIKVIWDKFKEINNTFFDLSQQAGLGDLLGKMKEAITADFGKLLVSSLKLDTEES